MCNLDGKMGEGKELTLENAEKERERKRDCSEESENKIIKDKILEY